MFCTSIQYLIRKGKVYVNGTMENKLNLNVFYLQK